MPITTPEENINVKLSSIYNVDNIIYNWPFYRNGRDINPLSLSMDGTRFLNHIASSNISIKYRDFSDWVCWALDESISRPDMDYRQIGFLSFLWEFYKYISYELRAIELEENIIENNIGNSTIIEWFNKYNDVYHDYVQRDIIDFYNVEMNLDYDEPFCEEQLEEEQLTEEEINRIVEEEDNFFREYYNEEI
tara:strand:+ start:1796 stop:2371 length:576 start_codon:yes stop_codon:yes gene_type:complete